MPWRSLTDPYKIAAAEILLQKTKGDAALPVWVSLVERWPTAVALASADAKAVCSLVASIGLGSQRTTRLQTMAKVLAQDVPGGAKTPGLGTYGETVLRLARGEVPRQIGVDGNIARVITRLKGLIFQRGEARKKREVHEAVLGLLSTEAASTDRLSLLYALVDVGASVCTPRSPSCGACPLAEWCASAFSLGDGTSAKRVE